MTSSNNYPDNKEPDSGWSAFWFILALVIIGLACAGCAHQDEWTKADTTMQWMVTAAYAADAYTTSKIKDDPNLREVGLGHNVLGRQPSTSDTYMYFGTLMISNYMISRALPARWRPYWQFANFAAHGHAALGNCKEGLGCARQGEQ